MEFSQPVADDLVKKALRGGIVINKISAETLRFLPTLIVTKKNINTLINWLNKNIKDL
jgi:acetylornithine/succinyldiaminopimelate/putrescine aminotransferase